MARKPGNVSLWHPWQEPERRTHTLSLLQSFNFQSIESAIATLSTGKYYAICHNIFREVPEDLIRDKRSEPFLSKNGHIAALRLKGKRGSGFIIPAIQWQEDRYPTHDTTANIQEIFDIFKREAVTPSSLSEKVLRATLPDKLIISRPSVALRRTILENRSIPRVTQWKRGIKSEEAYEYDKIKAYLSIASAGVPSPFSAPIRWVHSDIWQDMATSFMKVRIKAHVQKGKIQPLLLPNGIEGSRIPQDGEIIEKWLWSGKLQDCLEAGYTLEEASEGYSWYSLSGFMSEWANILFEACTAYKDESFYPILKRMTQGLPGRFLKAPEVYTLVHYTEYKRGDRPLENEWIGTESPMSNWFMRIDTESEEARESSQLTPIGDYIVSECERSMYHDAKKEEEKGNKVLRIYVDSLTLAMPAITLSTGTKPGQYKVKRYWQAFFEDNRFVGYDEYNVLVAKCPGMDDTTKQKYLIQKGYRGGNKPCLNTS
jgi:hypothetical protein